MGKVWSDGCRFLALVRLSTARMAWEACGIPKCAGSRDHRRICISECGNALGASEEWISSFKILRGAYVFIGNY